MSLLDTTPSSYFPPMVANRPPNPVVPVQNAPYVSAFKQQRSIDYVQGPTGAQNFDLAPNSSTLALDQDMNVLWVIATDQNGSKSVVKGFHIGEEYVPPKPVTMDDLMAELRDMKKRVINLEEDRNNGEHHQQSAKQSIPVRANAQPSNGNSASSADRKPASINGPKQSSDEAGV